MSSPFPPRILSAFRHALSALLMTLPLSCAGPGKPGMLPGLAPAHIAGQYQGTYTFGGAFGKQSGQTSRFVLTLHQSTGSGKISGTIQELWSGFGTAKGGFLWADVTGTCTQGEGVLHLRFQKKYRHFKHPVENYLGSLPTDSSLLTGTWYQADTPSRSGFFEISNFRPQ